MCRCDRQVARFLPAGCAPCQRRETRQQISCSHTGGPASCKVGEHISIIRQKGMHEIPQYVVDRDMTFLDAMDAVGADHETMIKISGCHLSTITSGKADGLEIHLLGDQEGLNEVVRVAARGYSD